MRPPKDAVLKPGLMAAISLFTCPIPGAASLFYQNVPAISLETSAGFDVGGTDYFLLKLHIYHKAKGVAAFPDGGIPSDAFESIYLFRLGKSGPQKVAELGMAGDLSSTYFKNSRIRSGKNGVLINIPWMDRKFHSKEHDPGRKGSEKADRYYLFDPVSAKITAIGDPGGEWPRGRLSLTDTNKPFRDFSDFDAAGLPNPLDYTPGAARPDGLARLISEGLGERRLRLAAARRLIASGNADLLPSAIAALGKAAAARKIYFWTEEKALLEKMLGTTAP